MGFDWSFYYWAELLNVVVTFYDLGEAFLLNIHFKVSVAFFNFRRQISKSSDNHFKYQGPTFSRPLFTQSRLSPRHFFTNRALLLAGALFEGPEHKFSFFWVLF